MYIFAIEMYSFCKNKKETLLLRYIMKKEYINFACSIVIISVIMAIWK